MAFVSMRLKASVLRSTAGLALASLAGTVAQAQPAPLEVEVLGHFVLPETSLDGHAVGEVSGLEWSRAEGTLYGVTDRGVLLAFDLARDGAGLGEVTPVSALALRDADGAEVDKAFNPEALEIEQADGGTRLLIASETGPAAALFDTAGTWISEADLPEAMRSSGQEEAENGIESVALHPVHGLLVAPEEPPAGADPRAHVIFAADGARFSYSATDIGASRLKAMEVLEDGRILLLERVKGEEKGSLIPYLRVLDPLACDAEGACPTQVARIDVPDILDADYEGLADLGDGLLLIASDDKMEGDLRTVFALLRLGA